MSHPIKKRPDVRRIKSKRAYTVDEAARTCGVGKQTVRRWVDSGLPAIKDQKPYLILGSDLQAFLKSRHRPKTKCADDQMYCLKCRDPRLVAERMADFIPMSETGGNLCGLCATCGTVMYRRCSFRQLGRFGEQWCITILQAPPHLIERAKACLDDNL